MVIGNSNTDVTNLPLWLRDNTKANKNAFGVIKEGAGTYIFTGTKNSDTGKVFLGLHVKKVVLISILRLMIRQLLHCVEVKKLQWLFMKVLLVVVMDV